MIRHIVVAVALAAALPAQANPGDSVVRRESRYVFSVRSGMAMCSTCTLDGPTSGYFNTVLGMRLTPGTRIGLGAGLTSASGTMIVPLFGSFKLNLFGKKNKVFAEANYGFALSPRHDIDETSWTQTVKTKSYFQPSIGYSVPYHDMKLGVMLGIQSLKMVTTTTYPGSWWGWGTNRQGTPNSSEFRYNVTRLVVGFSVGWRD
jgi:hypothetical protein